MPGVWTQSRDSEVAEPDRQPKSRWRWEEHGARSQGVSLPAGSLALGAAFAGGGSIVNADWAMRKVACGGVTQIAVTEQRDERTTPKYSYKEVVFQTIPQENPVVGC